MRILIRGNKAAELLVYYASLASTLSLFRLTYQFRFREMVLTFSLANSQSKTHNFVISLIRKMHLQPSTRNRLEEDFQSVDWSLNSKKHSHKEKEKEAMNVCLVDLNQ